MFAALLETLADAWDPRRMPYRRLRRVAERLDGTLAAAMTIRDYQPRPEDEAALRAWQARPGVELASQGGELAPEDMKEVDRAAVARWHTFMAAEGVAPEPNTRRGRPRQHDRLSLLWEIASAYERITGRRPGRTGTLRNEGAPSPFERFACAVLGLYGFPSSYGKASGRDSWVTAKRTRVVQALRKTQRDL